MFKQPKREALNYAEYHKDLKVSTSRKYLQVGTLIYSFYYNKTFEITEICRAQLVFISGRYVVSSYRVKNLNNPNDQRLMTIEEATRCELITPIVVDKTG